MRAKEEIALLHVKMAEGSLPEDEPLFVLRAKDKYAAGVVRYWARYCRNHQVGVPEDKLREAERLANEMDEWPIKQVPGRPETRTEAKDRRQG